MPAVTRVAILYCGQGMTTLVECYDNGNTAGAPDYLALIDCGGNTEEGVAAVDYIVERVLAKADKTLDLVVISHQDGDHVLLLKPLREKLAVGGAKGNQIFIGGRSWEKINKTRVKKFVDDMDIGDDGVKFNAPQESDYEDITTRANLGHLARHKKVYFRVLVSGLPISGSDDFVKNASSAVVVIDNGVLSCVLPGDATYQTMDAANDILDVKNLIPRVAGFEIPHHGALRTAVENYYAKGDIDDFDMKIITNFAGHLIPDEIVASAGPYNTHRHPVVEVMNVFDAALDPAADHRYAAYVFTKPHGSLTSEGWMNFSKVTKAKWCTVQKLEEGNHTVGDVLIDLDEFGVVAPHRRVRFRPRATFGPGGPADDPVYYAPAP